MGRMMERIPAIGWEDYRGHVDRYAYAAGRVRPGESVNDIACGVGYGLALLGPTVGRYRGYDRLGVGDPQFLAFLAGKPGEYVGCDLDAPDWLPEPADVTVCLGTLEHVQAPYRLAAAIAATTLRCVVVMVPTEPTRHLNGWHLHDFTVEQVPAMFAGFEVADRWWQPDELGHVWSLERPG